ncbi:MAG: DUF2007 domain-containing protein [bacterium]
MKTMSAPFVTIATFSRPFEAYLAKGKLESEGIEVFIADENIVGINWLLSNLVGGVKIQVREEEREKAVEILNQKTPVLELIHGSGPESGNENSGH